MNASARQLPRTAAFARSAIALSIAAGMNKGDPEGVAAIHSKLFPSHANEAREVAQFITRSNEVQGGTTGGGAWGQELAGNEADDQFLAAVRYQEILGNLPGVTDVLPNMAIGAAHNLFAAQVVGEGLPIPLSKASYDSIAVTPIKVAGLGVITDDLARRGNGVQIVGSGMRDAVVKATDAALLSTQSYGLLNGVSAAGDGAADVSEIDYQVRALLAGMTGADMDTTVLVCDTPTAIALSLLRLDIGPFAYPNVTAKGGTLCGLPLLVSTGAAASTLYAVDGSAIVKSEGGIEPDVSTQATLEMASDPTGSTVTPTAASKQRVSLFANNARAVRAIRVIGWKLRRANAVGYLSNFTPATAIVTA